MQDNRPTTVLVLGILGLTVCIVCAPVAWIMGNSYIRDCRTRGMQPESGGTIGRLLGIIGTALLVVSLGLGTLFFALGFLGALLG